MEKKLTNKTKKSKILYDLLISNEHNAKVSQDEILKLSFYDDTENYDQLIWGIEKINSGFWVGVDYFVVKRHLELFNKWKSKLTVENILKSLPDDLILSSKVQRILKNPQDINNYDSTHEIHAIINTIRGNYQDSFNFVLSESDNSYLHRKAEQATRKVVKDILNITKTNGLVTDDYILPDYFSGVDGDFYTFGDLQFLVRLDMIFDPNQTEKFTIIAEVGNEYGYEDEIFISVIMGRNFSKSDYEQLQYFLNDYVRHEIEHIVEYLETGELVRTNNDLTPFEYYTQPSELRAQKKGFGRRSKLEKKNMSDVVRQYLDYRNNIDKLSDTEKETLVKLLVSEEETKLRYKTLYDGEKYSIIIPLDVNTFCSLSPEKWCQPSYEESSISEFDGIKYILYDKEKNEKLLLVDIGVRPLNFSGDYMRLLDSDLRSHSVHKYMKDDLEMQKLLKLSYTLSERMEWGMDIPNEILEEMSNKNELTKIIYNIIQTNTDESRSMLTEFQGDDLEEMSTVPYYIEDNGYVINDNSIEFVIETDHYIKHILNLSDDEEYYYNLGTGGAYHHSYELDSDEINYIHDLLDSESLNDLKQLMVFVGELLPNQELPNLDDGFLNNFFKRYFESTWDNHIWDILDPLQDGLTENKIKDLEGTIESYIVFDHTEESDGYILGLTYPQLLYLVNDYNCETLSELMKFPINEIAEDLSEVYHSSYEFGDEAVEEMNVEFREVIEKIMDQYESDDELQNLVTNVSDFEKTIKDLGFFTRFGRYVFSDPNSGREVTIVKFDSKTGKVSYQIMGNSGLTSHISDLNTFINDVISERLFEGVTILKEEVHDLLKKHSFKLLNEWLLGECDQITHSDYPDSIFFKRRSDGKIVAEIDKKNELFLLHYNEIWSFFEKHFELKYEEILEIARDWLEEAFKLKGYTPDVAHLSRTARWKRLSN